jgi:hypothetical protein
MAVLALVLWSATALGGLYLLAIWLIEYDPDFEHAVPTRLPVLAITGHVLFAVAGLLSWVIYVVTGKDIYSWISVGALAAIATLGFTMAIRWIGVFRSWRRASSGPADPMPYAYGAYTLTAWARLRTKPAGNPGSSSGPVSPWQLAVPPERHLPVPVVIAHGVLAVTTVVLVVLTVLGEILLHTLLGRGSDHPHVAGGRPRPALRCGHTCRR